MYLLDAPGKIVAQILVDLGSRAAVKALATECAGKAHDTFRHDTVRPVVRAVDTVARRRVLKLGVNANLQHLA